MNTTSGQPVTVDILGSIQRLVGTSPNSGYSYSGSSRSWWRHPSCIFTSVFSAPSGDATFPMIYVFTSPLPVAVWTLFICRLRKIRQWQRAGKDLGVMGLNWREAEGGWVVSILKRFGITFLGGFSSFAVQMLTVFCYVHLMGWAVFFAPLYMTDPMPHDLCFLVRYAARDVFAHDRRADKRLGSPGQVCRRLTVLRDLDAEPEQRASIQ